MSVAIIPSKEEFEIIQTIAKAAADSKYFDKMGGLPGMLSIALYAREMGVPPLSALFGGMQNVMGKIQMSPEMMMSLIRQKGHKIEILECTDVICKIKGTRKDTGESYTSSYSISEAEKAGLVKSGSGWSKNPSDMLFARASGRLKRRLFPDVATKAYCEGELEEAHVETNHKVQDTIEIEKNTDEMPKEIELVTTEQAQIINEIIGDDEAYRSKLLNWLKIEAFHQLPAARYLQIVTAVTKNSQAKLAQSEPEVQE